MPSMLLVNAPLCTLPLTSRTQRHQCTCSASAGARGQAALSSMRAQRSRSRSTHTARRPTNAVAHLAPTSTLPPLLPIDDRYDDLHSFSDFAHWIIPGRLMVGRYPFCEPSRCKSRDLGEQQLERILGAGITAFVCLQSELPPQEQLRIGGKDGFLPYRPTAQLIAAALSGPPPTSSLHDLRTPDLDRFLPPRRKPAADAVGGAPRRELEFLHFGIADLSIPDDQCAAHYSALEAVSAIESMLRTGEAMYVHCWGGRGRSGLIAACLLGKVYGLQADEALERVSRAYQTREQETAEQVQFVRDFIAKHAV